MIGWLRRLFTGEPDCQHEYELHTTIEVYDHDLSTTTPAGRRYVLRCKKCGWMCSRKL